MTLVGVVNDTGLRGYGAAKAQQCQQQSRLGLADYRRAAASATARVLPGWSWETSPDALLAFVCPPEPPECKGELMLVIDPARGSRHQGWPQYVRWCTCSHS
jgi:hypothetical protein